MRRHNMPDTPRFVRCKDNMFQQDVLTVGRVYEVTGERYGNYLVLDRWLTPGRFMPATFEEWSAQR